MNLLWKLLAILALLLALVGTLLPVLPAIPFVLLAAAAASRGWPWLADRLRSHATLGPAIARWQERGALPRRVKVWSTVGLGISVIASWCIAMPQWAAVGLTVVLVAYAAWVWRRPQA